MGADNISFFAKVVQTKRKECGMFFLCWPCAVLCASTLLTTKRRDFRSESAPASSAVAPRPMAAMATATTTTAAESWDMVMRLCQEVVRIFGILLRNCSLLNWEGEMVQSLFSAAVLVCFAALPLASTSDNESVTVSDPIALPCICVPHCCCRLSCSASHFSSLHFYIP